MKSLAFSLHETANLMKRRFEQEAKPLGLTLQQWRVLGVLSREGTQRQSALVEATQSTPMTISDVLDRLEKAGLVHRAPSAEDSRAKDVSLTEQGTQKSQEIKAIAEGVFAQIFDGIPQGDLDTTIRTLTHICKNIEGA
ncbi:MarR family transcriptional regulator [Donghicola sp. C2-DW-16]|uniref:MarR family transcriptional regulator n=1 Tax=Donghicola mangrovi TaxID=2729614 RepID=A0ABX2PFU2_9RHOB|nr:MarR family transcriptional regulator [Donghicola mangrovi]